jgi:hypothetical protein
MIPLTGTTSDESYVARRGKLRTGEVLVIILGLTKPSRGELLAQSLDGRYAPGARGYFLSPSRAEKWHALWSSGFTARGFRILGKIHWRYAGDGWDNLQLYEAMRVVRGGVVV